MVSTRVVRPAISWGKGAIGGVNAPQIPMKIRRTKRQELPEPKPWQLVKSC